MTSDSKSQGREDGGLRLVQDTQTTPRSMPCADLAAPVEAEPFAELALQLHDEETERATVEAVLGFALNAVGCDYAGIIFIHGKTRVETVAATDPVIADLDKVQVELGHGPDISALDDVLSVIVRDTRTDRRWPGWAERVDQAGIRSLLNVRLYTSERTIGTLNLYSRKPNQFDQDDQAVAHVLARHASVALSTVRNEENLTQAIDARKRIGQAQGILMERYNLTAERAFTVLLRYSQNNNMKLRVVADHLIGQRELPKLPKLPKD